MNIPNIPTDNLYKFLALTGLLVVFASIGLLEYRLHVHEVENANIRVGKEALEYTTENYFKDLDNIADQFSSQFDALKNNPESFDKERAYALIDKYKHDLRQNLNRQSLTDMSMDLRLKSELADASASATKRMRLWLLFSVFVGSMATMSGFILWYFRLQRYQDEKIKNEVNDNK